MADLIVNGIAATNSSLGARRYYRGVMQHLEWPGEIFVNTPSASSYSKRLYEVLMRGRHDAVLWSPCHRGPLWACNHVVTVLDCINVEYVYRDSYKLPMLRLAFGQLLRNAVAVVAISKATRLAILRNFDIDPAKLQVIEGPTHFPGMDVDETLPDTMQTTRNDYILMVTNALAHKNTVKACQAIAQSAARERGVSLRVVGSLDPAGTQACQAAGIAVEAYQGIDDRLLRAWIKNSRFLFSPSLEEGLNLPVAEALSLGANVLCSDIPLHRDLYKERVRLCDPRSVSAMAYAIDHALESTGTWGLSQCAGLRRTFRDVAADYRLLFMRLAATAS